VKGYAAAYLLTLLVEPPLYAVALRRLQGTGAWRAYGEGLLANAGSHPIAWLVLYPLLGEGYAAFVAVEAFAVAWEARLLKVAGPDRDTAELVAVSLACNAVSLGLGALLSGR
jgi:fermentation-respiration switch protein FrsA (DUF1100 family)